MIDRLAKYFNHRVNGLRNRKLFLTNFICFGFYWFFALMSTIQAEPQAVVVTGIGGSLAATEEFESLALRTKQALAARGIAAENIQIFSGNVNRDVVLKKLQEASANCTAEEDFWLVLFGHGGQSAGGVPALQILGPRLTATDLKTALEANSARQFVVIGTSNSGAFLPILQDGKRTLVAANNTSQGGSDFPRFAEAWVKVFSEMPNAEFAKIAALAAERVDAEYRNSGLAQGEQARLADPVTGKILAPPFGLQMVKNDKAPTVPTETPDNAVGRIDEIQIKVNDPNAVWEQRPATEETRRIIAEASAVANPDGHASLVLEQRIGFKVEPDRTTDYNIYYRVFLARHEAIENWANLSLPQSAPAVTSKLKIARVINPDGSFTLFNPEKLLEGRDSDSGEATESAQVYLPNAQPGGVIEIAYQTRRLLDASMPYLSELLFLQQKAPVLSSEVEVMVPLKPLHRVVLKNIEAQAVESVEGKRQVYRLKLGMLPAGDILPGDPPWPLINKFVLISSLPSWNAFADWYRRLTKGSDEIDDSVQKMSQELAKASKSREEIIRRAYEFVSALRYVIVELGIGGLRPRTPAQVLARRYGDCKDKANLLIALLRAQGIKANLALVNRGSFTDVAFPSWQFNHAIAFVPRNAEEGQPEDMWLDATDGTSPFGFLPPGDLGREALVFDGESADFKTVTPGSSRVAEMYVAWEISENAQGIWDGKMMQTSTGIADYWQRSRFRGLSPNQRDLEIHRMLSELWREAEFTRAAVSDVDALDTSLTVSADVTAQSGRLPQMDNQWLGAFAAPTRDRPLWLNDGQPLVLTQTVRMNYAKAAPELLPPAFSQIVCGQKLSVTWERQGSQTVVRTARFELSQPLVATSDYKELRAAIRNWYAALDSKKP